MSVKPTAGPWAVNPFNARIDCQQLSEKGGLLPVCQMLWPTDERSEAETEANARLIAAAPDFAEVVPDAADLLDQYAGYIRAVKADELERHPYLPQLEDTVYALRAALAKAGAA